MSSSIDNFGYSTISKLRRGKQARHHFSHLHEPMREASAHSIVGRKFGFWLQATWAGYGWWSQKSGKRTCTLKPQAPAIDRCNNRGGSVRRCVLQNDLITYRAGLTHSCKRCPTQSWFRLAIGSSHFSLPCCGRLPGLQVVTKW